MDKIEAGIQERLDRYVGSSDSWCFVRQGTSGRKIRSVTLGQRMIPRLTLSKPYPKLELDSLIRTDPDFYNSLEKHLIKQRHPRVDAGMHMDVWFEPKIVIEIIASRNYIESNSHSWYGRR